MPSSASNLTYLLQAMQGLDLAREHVRAGRRAEGERLCRGILEREPQLALLASAAREAADGPGGKFSKVERTARSMSRWVYWWLWCC